MIKELERRKKLFQPFKPLRARQVVNLSTKLKFVKEFYYGK
jgi:hypothetical protein